MPRAHRDLTTDNRFHIINHGVDSQDLFSIDDDWMLFESMIGRVCGEYGFELNAYALMSNHYHLLVDLSSCEDRGAVSEAIGVMQSTYSKYFNHRTERRGPLFEPRFLGYGVDGDTKTHASMRYIHRNPIDICGPRALGNYRWSSLPVLLGRRDSPVWLDCSLFVPDDPSAHLADLSGARDADRWPLRDLAPQWRTTVDDIERAIRRVGEDSIDGRNHRHVLCLLAFEFRSADVIDLATHLASDTSTIRKIAKRSRQRRLDEPGFAHLLARVIAALPGT